MEHCVLGFDSDSLEEKLDSRGASAESLQFLAASEDLWMDGISGSFERLKLEGAAFGSEEWMHQREAAMMCIREVLTCVSAADRDKQQATRDWFQAMELLDALLLRSPILQGDLLSICCAIVRLTHKYQHRSKGPCGEILHKLMDATGVTDAEVNRQEKMVIHQLGWQVQPSTVATWVCLFRIRFEALRGSKGKDIAEELYSSSMRLAEQLVSRWPHYPEPRQSPRDMAAGLWFMAMPRGLDEPVDTLIEDIAWSTGCSLEQLSSSANGLIRSLQRPREECR